MSDKVAGQDPAGAAQEPHSGLESVAEEVLPALIARLRASRLGELEVRTDGWRVRLRRDGTASPVRTMASDPKTAQLETPAQLDGGVARSPAVGYFDPAPDLALGRTVQAGDLLGTIDVLGIVQDVIAPIDGIVSSILAEDGQAVEYGQPLADIDPLEVELESDAADDRTVVTGT